MSDAEKRYVILELSDAKALAASAVGALPDAIRAVVTRIESETGADIPDIVQRLKRLDFCPACVIEGQQRSCSCLAAQKLGRRLSRLVDRADGKPGYEEPADEPSPLPRTAENVLGHAQPEDPEAAAYREAVRQCQMEAARDIQDAVVRAVSVSNVLNKEMNSHLMDELNQLIAREIDAWRTRYSDVAEFASTEYSATAVDSPEDNRITVVWSPEFEALSRGRARVRMNPLPKHFRT